MTDLEKWKQFLDSFDVQYDETSYYDDEPRKQPILRLQEGNNKVTGYSCFYTDICFSKDGKFQEIVCLE